MMNLEAEQALLGSMMLYNDKLIKTAYLTPEHFSEPVHQRIYTAMKHLVFQGQMANPLTLAAYFERDEALEDIGGAKYLKTIAVKAGRVVEVDDYANLLIDLHQRREIVQLCDSVKAEVERFEWDNPAEKIATDILGKIEAILHQKPRSGSIVNNDVANFIAIELTKESPAFSTGYPRLDNAMDGGLYAGKSYGFAGRKKTGKTILAGSISYQLNLQGTKHLFIAGEMSPQEIEQRNIARGLDEYPSKFRKRGDEKFAARVAQYAHDLPRNVIYENAPGLTFSKLKEIVHMGISDHKISGIILDYWQLVGGKKNGQSTAEHLDEVAQWIADFCRKHNLWSIVMGQVNQEGNTRGGEGLRLAMDQVYQITRDDITQPSMWLEMMETRYTKWANIGGPSKEGAVATAGFTLMEKGPWYKEE